MSRRGQRALGLLVALAGLAGAWLAFARDRWLVGLLATAAANLGAVWALMQGDRPPPRVPPESPAKPDGA